MCADIAKNGAPKQIHQALRRMRLLLCLYGPRVGTRGVNTNWREGGTSRAVAIAAQPSRRGSSSARSKKKRTLTHICAAPVYAKFPLQRHFLTRSFLVPCCEIRFIDRSRNENGELSMKALAIVPFLLLGLATTGEAQTPQPAPLQFNGLVFDPPANSYGAPVMTRPVVQRHVRRHRRARSSD